MARHDSQATQEQQQALHDETTPHVVDAKPAPQLEKTAAAKPEKPFEDDDTVTVIWRSWGTSGMPRNKVSYFDRYQFTGGVGRLIPYKVAKKWQQQGHGLHILPANAEEIDFIKATGHAPMADEDLETLLRSVPLSKLAAMLGPENLDKIATMKQK